jgi:hypothetical protein
VPRVTHPEGRPGGDSEWGVKRRADVSVCYATRQQAFPGIGYVYLGLMKREQERPVGGAMSRVRDIPVMTMAQRNPPVNTARTLSHH